MARTPSTMVALGTEAPGFALADPSGRVWRWEDVAEARATVVIFVCNHCPFVKHIGAGLAQIARDFAGRPVGFVAINSNDVRTHPEDAPEKMAEAARAWGWTFPYLFDESQAVARAYDAACTPDFFVYDGARRLAYRGQMDGSRPGNEIPVTGSDLRAAVDALVSGRMPSGVQMPSIGCNIKWKPGNEPR